MIARRVRTARYRVLFLLGFLGALWLASAWAELQAAPGGLNAISTADFYEPGVSSLEFQTEGEGRLLGSGRSDLALVQFGVTRGLEAGLDRSTIDGGPTSFNAKLRLLNGEGRRPALAVGVQNVARGQVAQPRLVSGWGFGRPLRVHLDAVTAEGKPMPMLGADYTWRGLTFQADWVGGRENTAGAGISWAPHPNLTFTYSLLIPNSGGGPRRRVANVQHLLRFR